MTLAPKDYGLTRVALSSETNSVAVPPGTMTLAQAALVSTPFA